MEIPLRKLAFFLLVIIGSFLSMSVGQFSRGTVFRRRNALRATSVTIALDAVESAAECANICATRDACTGFNFRETTCELVEGSVTVEVADHWSVWIPHTSDIQRYVCETEDCIELYR